MCGISGILSFDGAKVEERSLAALTGFLAHRGPDALGVWLGENHRIGLGHARLSILDLRPEAAQPMVSPNRRNVIVFNGEIYNFVEIAKVLQKEGYKFQTSTDTEVVLHAWDCWGMEMFPRFNGMWALAIHDNVTGETILCRDRFGVKPLYYCASDRRLVFASEVQAIDKLLPGEFSVDRNFVGEFLSYDLSAYGFEQTYLKEIKALLPGHWMRINRGGQIETRRWYWLKPQQVPDTLAEQAETLRELATDACRLRLRSDVPVATCLSGGIDSGSIVALLSMMSAGEDGRFAGFSHKSFTAAFPGTTMDETDAARLLSATLHVKLDVKVIDCPAPAELEKAMLACDGPMPALAFYPIWKLYQHIRSQGIAVTLDGQGADEMLGGYYLGYPALRGAWQARRMRWFYDLYRTYGALHPDATRWIQNDCSSALKLGAAEFDQACKRPIKKMLGAIGLYKAKPSKLPLPAQPPDCVSQDHPMRENAFALALWRQFFVTPLPFLLHQYDRCSMASAVECRMPFMDYRLVEYVFSLPLKSRVGGGFTKRVLREAVRGVLPDSIRINRQKTGFNAPFSGWMDGPLKSWVLDLSGSRSFIENEFFDGVGQSRAIHKALECDSGRLDERTYWPSLHLAYWMAQRRSFSPSNQSDLSLRQLSTEVP